MTIYNCCTCPHKKLEGRLHLDTRFKCGLAKKKIHAVVFDNYDLVTKSCPCLDR